VKKDPTFLRQGLFARDTDGKIITDNVGHPVMHRVWRDWFSDVIISQVLADEQSILQMFDFPSKNEGDPLSDNNEPLFASLQGRIDDLGSTQAIMGSLSMQSIAPELDISPWMATQTSLGALKQDIEDLQVLSGIGMISASKKHSILTNLDYASAGHTGFLADTDAAVGGRIFAASTKNPPIDTDILALSDSAAANILKGLTWANVKGTLKTYTDTLYAPVAHNILSATHGDTLADTVIRGDILYGNATPKWARLPFPASPIRKILQATATDIAWSTYSLAIGVGAAISGTNTGDNAANSSTMYIGTTVHALNRASAPEGLTGITGLTPAADFTLTQNGVAAFTSVEAGAIVNTLYLQNGKVGIGIIPTIYKLTINGSVITYGIIYTNVDSADALASQWQLNGATDPNKQILIGFNTTLNYASIQAIWQGNSYRNLILCGGGANVGIGTFTPGSKLSIVGLPVSVVGLSTGDIWVDTTGGLNILKIV
jgi:hypothetical protein